MSFIWCTLEVLNGIGRSPELVLTLSVTCESSGVSTVISITVGNTAVKAKNTKINQEYASSLENHKKRKKKKIEVSLK